jgi:hypothetical protein
MKAIETILKVFYDRKESITEECFLLISLCHCPTQQYEDWRSRKKRRRMINNWKTHRKSWIIRILTLHCCRRSTFHFHLCKLLHWTFFIYICFLHLVLWLFSTYKKKTTRKKFIYRNIETWDWFLTCFTLPLCK